jgi:hypothetical protein
MEAESVENDPRDGQDRVLAPFSRVSISAQDSEQGWLMALTKAAKSAFVASGSFAVTPIADQPIPAVPSRWP